MEIVEAVANIIESVGIIIASIVAIKGVNAWRNELSGRRRYELAEEVLTLAYEVRDRLRQIRSILGYEGEGRTRKKEENEDPRVSERLDEAYVFIERFQAHRSPFDRIQVLRYAFQATFGKEAAAPLFEIQRITSALHHAATMLSVYARQPVVSPAGAVRQGEERREQEATLRDGSGEDAIAKRMDKVVSDLETLCAPVLGAKA